ncbi:hypothetical protein [Trueperella pyogenes]|uniref:hypothetical protein n=1 Tax=Trueperella pyogenes TaxID=1661 RepID=UPI001982593D|nr:hypothetical protein [Trueperella pyogenes]
MRANASVSAEQETREAGKGALLLGEGSLAFDVEVFGDFDGGVLGGEVVEEEDSRTSRSSSLRLSQAGLNQSM